jgi:hypothetical protein
MPAFWVQAVLPFVAASAVATSPRAWLRVASRIAASLVIALQLAHAHLRADFARFVPTDKDRAAAEALVDELRALPDPILMPHAPWYARLAGKRVSFGLITLWDIDHPDGTFRPGARAIDEQIAAGYFPVAVVPDDKLGHGLKAYFARQRSITTKGLGTRTGWPVRLRTVWTYKGSDPTPTGS